MNPDNHESIVNDWQANAARDVERNYRFLRSLKMYEHSDRVDRVAGELHEEAFRKVDCLRCANCCKTMRPKVTEEDVDRIAPHLGLTAGEFTRTYLETDPDEPGMWMKSLPCPFLGEDNRCKIYDVRPEDCRSFPHTHKEGFVFRTIGHAQNTENCPAVFYIVERMRGRFGRRRRRR